MEDGFRDDLQRGLMGLAAYSPEDIRIVLTEADWLLVSRGIVVGLQPTLMGYPVERDSQARRSRFVIENDKGLRVSIPFRPAVS